MIVVDTNLIVHFKLDSDYSELAVKAYRQDPAWVAPILWRSEFSNVLALYLRKNMISLAQAGQIVDEAIDLVAVEYQVAPARVLELVSISTCSAYDCEFVALAQELGVLLVTSDRQILRQFPDTAVSLEQFVA